MNKRKKIAKSKTHANKKAVKKVSKKQKPKQNKGKIKLKIIQVEDSSHVEEKIARPRGRPKGKKKKIEPIDGVVAEKKISNVYFTPATEDAIVAYNQTEDAREKDRIYNESIQGAFGKIAENVYNTFKFSYADVSPLEIQKQAISHMVANMSKYEKGKGKAFSYFSIVAKHWFILDNNTTYRRFKKHVEICEQTGDAGEFVVEPEHEKQESETREFIKLMVEYWDKNVGKHFTKERDLKIANAVVEIFRNADRIDVFNKKALYLYIREIADCQTQHITKVINKLMEPQRKIRDEYYSTGKITGAFD
jgi:hypothetical protein